HLVTSGAGQRRQRDMQERTVGGIYMRVFFVELFSGRIKDLDAAKCRLDRFGEPKPHLRWRGMHFSSDSGIGTLQKGVGARLRNRDKHEKTSEKDATNRAHLVPLTRCRPKLCGKRSSR